MFSCKVSGAAAARTTACHAEETICACSLYTACVSFVFESAFACVYVIEHVLEGGLNVPAPARAHP